MWDIILTVRYTVFKSADKNASPLALGGFGIELHGCANSCAFSQPQAASNSEP